jgi:hypothetical protein
MYSLSAAAIRSSGHQRFTDLDENCGCNDFGSTRPNRANLLASIRSLLPLAPCRPLHQPRVGRQHFVPATADDVLHPGRVCPQLENYSSRIQCLKEFGNLLLRRTQLSLRQRFPLQIQNAVVARLVSQIHTHLQTIEIGRSSPRGCFSPALVVAFFFGSNFSFSFSTSSASTSFVSRRTGPRGFARVDVGSLFF